MSYGDLPVTAVKFIDNPNLPGPPNEPPTSDVAPPAVPSIPGDPDNVPEQSLPTNPNPEEPKGGG